jgi:hypothetical protein
VIEDFEGALDEFLIRDFAGFVGIFEDASSSGRGAVFRTEDGEVESLEVEFEENVSDVVRGRSWTLLILERMKFAASRAAAGRAYRARRFFCSRQRVASLARRSEMDSRMALAEVAREPVWNLVEEFDVAFLLAGHDVVNEHGALCGDGFVHGGSAGFANDEVVGERSSGTLRVQPLMWMRPG